MAIAFVTGGSGFVGRNLIQALIARCDSVRALARSPASMKAVETLGAEAIAGDLDDAEALRSAMQGCDVVFHAAAKVEEWGDPADFYRINVTGTKNALNAARAAGVACFVHVSTEAVLATGEPIIDVDETRPRQPQKTVARYPRTKALAEERVIAANAADFRTVSVRPRMIWGNDDTSLLPQIVEAVNQGRFMWINKGRYPTSTTHVENVVEGLLLAAEKGLGGEVYFVTDGPPIELRQFLTELAATRGVEIPDKSLPHWLALVLAKTCETLWGLLRINGSPPISQVVVRLLGEPVTVDDSKARHELGYQARVDRQAALARMKG